MPKFLISLAVLPLIALSAAAQESPALPLDGRDGRQLLLENFRPQSMLKVEQHDLRRAKFPVVDVHSHLFVRLRHSPEQLDAFVQVMDRNNIALCVSLDGTLGDKFDEHQKHLSKYEDRFIIFANIDFQGAGNAGEPATWDVNRPDFARRVARQLTEAKGHGAAGLKLFKQFGLEYKNADGSLIAIDDPRFDPIWQACGELGLPVLIHTADPAAFFLPIDEKNERWEELHRRPDWSFYGDKFPQREELLAALNRVIEKHPKTNFIGAHVANNAEDLKSVAQWLDKHPNLHVEIASRISELGRQPYTARAFFLKYQDRILFGTDGPWPEGRLRLYWRFLETYDEHFPYSEKEFPPQGLWNICGIGLPDEVLRKVYYENAERLVPGVREKLGARQGK
jgi:predicted TIM-barrel fold metal-dependent hydrolase